MRDRKYTDRALVEIRLPDTADFSEFTTFDSFVDYVTNLEELNPSYRIIDTAKDMFLKAKRLEVKDPAIRILSIGTFCALAENSNYPDVVKVRLEVTGKRKATRQRKSKLDKVKRELNDGKDPPRTT